MDIHGYSSCDQSSLINALTQGMEVAKQLKTRMGPEYSVQTNQMLLQRILSSYDEALFILGWDRISKQPHQSFPGSLPVITCSPVSTMESPKSDDLQVGFNASDQDGKERSTKKRKAASTWTKQVQVNSGTSPETPPADGSSWRKYGQKDILGAKHPRSYYRCTYRSSHDCWATKQIQRSDEDPTVFHITYKGNHTCTVECRSKSAPTSPGKQEAKPDDLVSMLYQQDSTMALSLQNELISNTQNIDPSPFSWPEFGSLNGESPHFLPSTINNTDNFCGSFSPSLNTPSTSGSNYFSMSPCVTDTFASFQHQEHNSECDIAEMLSVSISADYPAIEQVFQLDTWNFSRNLSFNNL